VTPGLPELASRKSTRLAQHSLALLKRQAAGA